MPIIVFGSLNHDLVTHTNKFPSPGETVTGVSFQDHLGGKGFNEAIACAKLKSPNDKFNVKLFGYLGDDLISNEFINYLSNLNIKTDLIKKLSNIKTGTASIIVEDSSNGENRIIVVPGANGKFDPSLDELSNIFNPSNHIDLNSSINNPNLPSNIHSHSTKPLNNESMVETIDINPHPPSNLHSHSSTSSFKNIINKNNNDSSNGLVYKNGSLIHSWSASNNNLNSLNYNESINLNPNITENENVFNLNPHTTKPLQTNSIPSSGSFIHSHKIQDISVSKITGSINDNNSKYPSDLHSHASTPKLETLTYPSPKPSALDLKNAAITLASKAPISNNSNSNLNLNLTAQNRLTNISFSLGGSTAHSSTASLNKNSSSRTYLQNISNSLYQNQNQNQITTKDVIYSDDLKYFVILQNEIPNPHKIINHLSNNFSNVEIFYNPSPLPNNSKDYNSILLNSLHQSDYIILNEHEILNIIKNYHPTPNREPLTYLKNISNFEPNFENLSIINENISLLSKLRTLLTKPALIITLGAYGVLYSDKGKFTYSYIPSEDVDSDEIIDTTGAGDTFLGAIATCIYRNESLESSIKFATKASAETIKKSGAAESMPFYKDVEKRGWLL
jgi:sugar/nucleoside kinase (ribokinase family)